MTGSVETPTASPRAGRGPWLLLLPAVLVVAWSPRLVPGSFATDDLAFMNAEADPVTMLHQGRPGQALLWAMFRALGAHPVHSGSLLNWLAVGLLAVSSLGLLRLWRVRPGLVPVLCVALAFVHPNLAETFVFRFTPVFFAVAIALAVGGLLLAREGALGWGALVLIASFSVYQVTLSTLLVALLLGLVLELVRESSTLRSALAAWARPAGAVGIAAGAYLVLQRLAASALGSSVQGERARFLPPEELPARLRALGPVFRRVVGADPVLSTRLLLLLQHAILGAALALVVVTLARRRRWAEVAVAVVSIVLAPAAVVGVLAVLAEFWPAPRVLTAAGPLWAGLLLVLSETVRGRWQWAPAAIAVALLVGYAGIDHRVASDQLRLNSRELALASRIVGRLEGMPGWSAVERVAIIGRSRAVPGIPQEYDLNPSALSVPWSRVMLLREVTDRRLAEPSSAELAAAEQRCAGTEPWPAPGSVFIEGPLATVCLR